MSRTARGSLVYGSVSLWLVVVVVAVAAAATLAGAASSESAGAGKRSQNNWVERLGEDDWDRLLEGEWMVEFYAPWCPACKSLEPIWDGLAFQKKELGINVAKIDVTDSPGLSGRFMVTALPMIYHVKDGVFRQYKSPRDQDSLVQFVSKQIWTKVDPVSAWKSPTSIQMSLVSEIFKMSQLLRGVHNRLMEDYGLPTWSIYLILAIGTIVLGVVLGLLVVCVIDFIYPPKDPAHYLKKHQKANSSGAGGGGGFVHEKSSGDEELLDGVKDDLVDEEASDSEERSEAEKNDKSSPNSPNIRKRRSRKAD